MGKLFVFIALLISTFSFACSCMHGAFGEDFVNNDFVAEIEILKTYNVDFKIDDEDRFYKANIKILKQYKGIPIQSILVAGKVGESYNAACEIELKKGDRFLVYLKKDARYIMSYCTSRRSLLDNKIETERKALQFLIKRNISKTDCYSSRGNFEKFKNLNPKNNFAVYKVKVNAKSKIESISVIQDFGTSKDSEIRSLIKADFRMVRGLLKEIKDEEVTLVLFFDKKNRYVISPIV